MKVFDGLILHGGTWLGVINPTVLLPVAHYKLDGADRQMLMDDVLWIFEAWQINSVAGCSRVIMPSSDIMHSPPANGSLTFRWHLP